MTTIAQLLGTESEVTKVFDDKLSGNAAFTLPGPVAAVMPIDQVLSSVWQLLDTLHVEEILAVAWEKHSEVEAAKLATAGSPLATKLVNMSGRKLVSTHKPSIDCSVAGVSHAVMKLQLKLSLAIDAVNLVVKAGRLESIGPGNATAEISLDVIDLPVVKTVNIFDEKKVTKIDLDPEIQPPLPKHLDD